MSLSYQLVLVSTTAKTHNLLLASQDEKPPIPVYEELQLDVKAYDYVPLERYSKYIHHTLLSHHAEVEW